MIYIEDKQLDKYFVRVEYHFEYGAMTSSCTLTTNLQGTKEVECKSVIENSLKALQNSELYHRLSRDSLAPTRELKCYVGSEIYKIVTRPSIPTIELRTKTPGKVTTGANSELLIDGEPVKGVTSVSINVDANGMGRVKLELIGNIKASGKFADVDIEYK